MVRTSCAAVFMVLTAMALLCMLAGTSGAAAGDTTRVNVDSSGTQANGGDSGTPSISADGRYVAFYSSTPSLVPDDTNGLDDIFVRDLMTGTTQRVSVDSSEAEANGRSLRSPSISADGRYVAFHSEASNLVPDDTNGFSDVFVRDLKEGTTQRVSVDSSGNQGNKDSSAGDRPSISADGRFVVFSSWASNLVPYYDRTSGDIFVHDLKEGTTKEMSVGPNFGPETDGTSFAPSISSSGRYVAYFSTSSDLVSDDTNNATDVFVRDRDADADGIFDEYAWSDGYTQRVRVDCAYSLCAWYLFKFVTSISCNGRYVTFPLPDSKLVAGDTNGVDDIFVHDRQMRTTQRVSVDSSEAEANGRSSNPRISDDGRFVAFDSAASNLVAGDTNTFKDVFVRGLQAGMTQRVSIDGSGAQANGHSFSPSISSDGTYVAFSSGASNLVANDTNGLSDVFVHERQTATTQPTDCIAPTSTASATTNSGADYTSGTWTNEDVQVTLSAQDNEGGSGVQDISYSAYGADAISQQTVVAADLPATFTIDAEGPFTAIRYFATDNAGNQESPYKTLTVTIDKTPPTANVTINGGDSFTNDTAVNLTLSGGNLSAGSGVAQMRFSGNGTSWSEWEPFATSKAWMVSGGDGEKTVYVQFKDAAGNESATAQDTIGLDTAAPITTHAVSPPPNANGWNNAYVIVTLDAIDTGDSGVEQISYSISDGANRTYNPTNKIPVNTEGTTTISYFATDNAGNRESPAKTFAVKLDKSAPTLDTDSSDGSDGITPNNRQIGVRRNIMPKATFSDEMDPSSLSTSAKLYQWNAVKNVWQLVPTAVSVEGKTATLDPYPSDPTRLLAANKKFKVTVTTGAKNLAGIPISSPKSWTFTTGSS